uniref:Uncharacterized protein n=1 Tax=Alexandrium andersonii TaxID=327968 RepID=A0A7S2AW84_9DINO
MEPPLCWAVRNGCSASVVALLLAHGADVEAADNEGQTPLSILASTQDGQRSGHQCSRAHDHFSDFRVPDALLGGLEIGDFGLPADVPAVLGFLARSLREERLSVAQALIEAGADPSSPSGGGMRPLDLAFSRGNEYMLQSWL